MYTPLISSIVLAIVTGIILGGAYGRQFARRLAPITPLRGCSTQRGPRTSTFFTGFITNYILLAVCLGVLVLRTTVNLPVLLCAFLATFSLQVYLFVRRQP